MDAYLAYEAERCAPGLGIVNIGVHTGDSVLSMAGKGNVVYGVDPWEHPDNTQKRLGVVEYRLVAEERLAGVPDVVLVQDFSIPYARTYDGPPVGLLYLDGAHDFASVFGEMCAWNVRLAEEAVVVVDDVRLNNRARVPMVEACNAMVQHWGPWTRPPDGSARLAVFRPGG